MVDMLHWCRKRYEENNTESFQNMQTGIYWLGTELTYRQAENHRGSTY